MSNAKVNVIEILSDYRGISIIGQHFEGKVHPVTIELLGEGRKLADRLGCPLSAVLIGKDLAPLAQSIAHFGADKIICLENDLLQDYTVDGYTKAVCDYIKAEKPETVLFGASSIGRDFAPRVAARIGTGLTADCTALDIDETDGKLLQTRPAFGGNLMATIICPKNRPQMSTVRPGVMKKALEVSAASDVVVRHVELDASELLVETIKTVLDTDRKISLADADVIVAGGRGVGSTQNFELLNALAKELGGTVSGSRAAVESGWIDAAYQVGQTGQTVRPKLYIACGISGAIQHMAGMDESEYIIAINKNPDAPIMKSAHLAIEGDLHLVIPEILKNIAGRRLG